MRILISTTGSQSPLFDTASGALVARAGAFENVVTHLAFSRDGRCLAAMLGENAGLRFIDTATWRQVAADKATGGNAYGVAFGPDGRLYALANGSIRRYATGPTFRLEAVVKTHGGRVPHSIAVDPMGERIAVSFDDTTAIDLYVANSLSYYAASGINGAGAGFTGIAWRSDGKVLIAAGDYRRDGKVSFLLFGTAASASKTRRTRSHRTRFAASRSVGINLYLRRATLRLASLTELAAQFWFVGA